MFKGLKHYEDPLFAPEFNRQGDSPTDKGGRKQRHRVGLGKRDLEASMKELLMVWSVLDLTQRFSSLTITMRYTSGRAGGPSRTRSPALPASAGPPTERVPWRLCSSTAEVSVPGRWAGAVGKPAGLQHGAQRRPSRVSAGRGTVPDLVLPFCVCQPTLRKPSSERASVFFPLTSELY